MNELKTVSINTNDITVKEYQGKRVVTFKDIDLCHERPDGTARRNFNQNKQHFIEGTDYFVVKPSDIQMDEFRTSEINNRGTTLITETGYLMLVKSFTDDLAWDVQRQLVNTYFRVATFHAEDEVMIFENPDFGSIRALKIDGMPYFVGKDVTQAIGYKNTRDALAQHVDDEDKLKERIIISGQNRNVTLINESGLYSVILLSKLPKAKEFKHWVTSEVLPSIRKTGMYSTANTQTQQHLAQVELLNAQYQVLKLLAENPNLQNIYPVSAEMDIAPTAIQQKRKNPKRKSPLNPLYALWVRLKQRCYNEESKTYKNYGGKGATVCDEWISDFEAFEKWSMDNGYKKGKYLIRINIKGEFSPQNCKWSRIRQNP